MSLDPRLLDAAKAPPSPWRWTLLTQLLDRTTPEDQHDALEALGAALDAAAWPHHLRTLPRRWLRALIGGQDVPAAALARSAAFTDTPLQTEDLRIALHHPRLAHLTHLHLLLALLGAWAPWNVQHLGGLLLHTLRTIPQRATLTSLTLEGGRLDPDDLTLLLGVEGLHNLRHLSLQRLVPLNNEHLAALNSCPLPHLEALEIASPWPTSPRSFMDLTRLHHLSQLKDLCLIYFIFDREELQTLANHLNPALERLALGDRFAMTLRHDGVGPLLGGHFSQPLPLHAEGIIDLLNTTSRLRTLELPRLQLERSAIPKLADLPVLAALEHLNLTSTAPNLAAPLVRAATRLRTLHLEGHRFTPDLREPLHALEHLEALAIVGAELSDADLDPIAPRLRRLDLHHWHVAGERALQLARHPKLQHLEHLTLPHQDLTNTRLKRLAQTRSLQQLKTLTLATNTPSKVDWDGAAALITEAHLPALEGLTLGFNREVKALKRRERPLREAALQRSLGLRVWADDHAEDDACTDLLKALKPRTPRTTPQPADPAERLTALRDLLYNDPSPDTWTTLLDLLTEDHPDAALRRDYAANLLEQRWPDHLRTTSHRLAWTLEPDATPHPALALCRAWDDCGLRRLDALPELLTHTALNTITTLRLPLDALADAEGETLPWTDTVQTLELYGPSLLETTTPPRLLSHVARAALPALRALALHDLDLALLNVELLTRRPWLSHLQRLSLTATPLPPSAPRALLRATGPALNTLQLLACDLQRLDPIDTLPCAQTLERLDLTANSNLSIGSLFTPGATFPALRDLALLGCSDADDNMIALLDTHMPALERLTLGPLHDEAPLEDLSLWSGLERLHTLTLNHPHLNDNQLGSLSRSPNLTSLEKLTLSDGPFDAPGLDALAWSDALTALRDLDLSYVHLSSNALRNLAASPLAQRLQRLALTFSYRLLHPTRILTDSPHGWPALHTLALPHSAIGAEGAEHLARWPGLAHLTALDLSGCWLGDDGLRILLASPHLGRLHTLRLDHNNLSERAAEAIAACSNLGDLHTLSLVNNHLGSNEARLLAASPHLTQLQRLDLSNNNRLRVGGLRALVTSPRLTRLHTLHAPLNACTDLSLRDRVAIRPHLFTRSPQDLTLHTSTFAPLR